MSITLSVIRFRRFPPLNLEGVVSPCKHEFPPIKTNTCRIVPNGVLVYQVLSKSSIVKWQMVVIWTKAENFCKHVTSRIAGTFWTRWEFLPRRLRRTVNPKAGPATPLWSNCAGRVDRRWRIEEEKKRCVSSWDRQPDSSVGL